MKTFKLVFFAITYFFITSIFLVSCVSLKEQHVFDFENEFVYLPDSFSWEQVTDEIQYSMINLPQSPLIYHIVKIDLNSTDIQIVGYIENCSKNKNKAILIDKFYKKIKPTIGFNTSPFKVSNRLALAFPFVPAKFENLGIYIAEGVTYSSAVDKYCALAFFKESDGSYRAEIFDSQKDSLNADYAFGGFYTILRDGEKRTFPANNYDSRTGVGISSDGKTLFVLIVEGEKQKKSLGLPYPACADIFLELGCNTAMQFDGGGSSGLYVKGKNVMTYKPRRKNPSFMGFRVKK